MNTTKGFGGRVFLGCALVVGAFLVGGLRTAWAGSAWLPSPTEAPMEAWSMFYGTLPEKVPARSAWLIGVIQPGYAYDQRAGRSQAQFYRLRAGFRGKLSKNVNFWFLSEFARNGATLDYLQDSPNPLIKEFHGARLLDASATLNQIPNVHVQIGQFLVPFTVSGITPAPVVPWINYTDAQIHIFYKEGFSDPTINAGRELGVMAFNQWRHGVKSVDYAVGVFNGTGLLQADTNKSKDVIGHLGFAHGPFMLNTGVWYGQERSAGQDLKREKASLEVNYGNFLKDKVWLWGTFLYAHEQEPAAKPISASGWFIAGGLRPTHRTELVVRYSQYHPDISRPQSTNMVSAIVTIYGSHKIRYMLEYDDRMFASTALPNDQRVNFMLSIPFSFKL